MIVLAELLFDSSSACAKTTPRPPDLLEPGLVGIQFEFTRCFPEYFWITFGGVYGIKSVYCFLLNSDGGNKSPT